MDASSLITQVKKFEDNTNGNNGEKVEPLKKNQSRNECNVEFCSVVETRTALHCPQNEPTTITTNFKRKKSKYEFSSGQPNSSPSSGSRFLSQLFCCCFGLGHLPDYQVGNNAAPDEAPEAVANHPPDNLSSAEEIAQNELQQSSSAIDSPSDDALFAFTDLGGLLSPPVPDLAGRICAVIDLDETLVHSSFQCPGEPDFIIEVEVEDVQHKIFVLKRPFVDEFLDRVGQLFECVLFTASMGKYADPVSDALDPNGAIRHRLFREACVYHCDSYVKDLGTLGRPVDRCFIMDNSPASYMFNLENAIHVNTWTGEPDDTELRDLIPYLERLAKAESVSEFLRNNSSPTGEPVTMAQMAVAMQSMALDS